jgi:hypothetical protein
MKSEIDRFWEKVNKLQPSECWEWQGSSNHDGYGIFLRERGTKQVRAHRVAWELEKGPIPDGLCVLHKCDNRSCCNPGHLFLGTKKQNMEDAKEKERHAHGSRHGRAILDEVEVQKIRKRCFNGERVSRVAREYGLAPVTIFKAAIGKSWSHVPGAVDEDYMYWLAGH